MLIAIDPVTLKRRVFVSGVGAAAIDPLHQLLWFNNNAGMWTLDLEHPCAAPRAAILGPAGGDFGISFGDGEGVGSVSTNCGSHQIEWTIAPGSQPVTSRRGETFRINEVFVRELVKAGPGKPTPIAKGRVALGGSGASLVVDGSGCAIEAAGKRREFECSGVFDLHLDRAGKRWIYGGDVCTADGCRTWETAEDADYGARPVGWVRPGPIWAVADTSEGC